MSLAVLGLGTAVPPTQLRQHETQRIALALAGASDEQASWLPDLYAHTGIRTRYTFFSAALVRDVLEGTRHSGSVFLPTGAADDRGPTTGERMKHYARHAPPLAEAAARQALEQSGLRANDLTHLVTVSCTGFGAPGVDVELIQRLGLPATIERTHVGYMGCHGALNGLRVARALVDADPAARVLLCAVELCSLHYYYGWDPQKVIAHALFADGAAALIGGWGDEAPHASWRLGASGSCMFPDSAGAMRWTIGDHGFAMTLSREVPELIGKHLRPWLARWLDLQRLAVADVASWAIHPGGPKILDAVAAALDLQPADMAPSRGVLTDHGNMSSPTLLFILECLRQTGAARPCVALGFGPGLTVEAGLFL
jgi:predicted naringenin-chalcone synthase